MSLFVQNISLRLSNARNLVEKVTLPPLDKGKIDITVAPGTIAVIGNMTFKGQQTPHKVQREVLGIKKSTVDAFLLPDKAFDNITIPFFGGQHVVSISSLTTAKAKFSIVGSATVEISDYKDLANYFNRTMTKEDLIAAINQDVRGHLSNEVSVAASQHITPETTDVTLRAALDQVAQDVMQSRKTASLLMNMGLMLSARGISMHLNALDDAEDKLKAINDALTDKAIASLDDDERDREERDRAAARQHELDLTRVRRTDYTDVNENKTVTTNTNGNGHVTINNVSPKAGKKYCPECGAEVKSDQKFCSSCGHKL